MTDKHFETCKQIIKDKSVDKEIKLFLILDMLHHNKISINKARELCTEIGVFSDHWVAVDGKATEVFTPIYTQLLGKNNQDKQ